MLFFLCFFLNSCGIDFRGSSKNIAINWILPYSENEATSFIFRSFRQHIIEFKNKISSFDNYPHEIFGGEKIQDKCQKTSVTVSDDLCFF